MLSRQDKSSAVGVGKSPAGLGRCAFCANCSTDGHEEAGTRFSIGSKHDRLKFVPKGGGRASHVLAKGSKHSIGTGTESDNVGCAKDETDDEADT